MYQMYPPTWNKNKNQTGWAKDSSQESTLDEYHELHMAVTHLHILSMYDYLAGLRASMTSPIGPGHGIKRV